MKNKKFDFMISKSKENKLMPVILHSSNNVPFTSEIDDLGKIYLRLDVGFLLDYKLIKPMSQYVINNPLQRYCVSFLYIKNIRKNKKIENLNYKCFFDNTKRNYNYISITPMKWNYFLTNSIYYDNKICTPYFNSTSIIEKIYKHNVYYCHTIYVSQYDNDYLNSINYDFVVKVSRFMYHYVGCILKYINCNFSKINDFIQYYIETSDSDYKKFFKDYEINNKDLIKYLKIYYYHKRKIKYTIVKLDVLQILFNYVINYPKFRDYYSTTKSLNWLEDEK